MSNRPQRRARARSRDLGFGTVVSDQIRNRLLERDGSFNLHRRGLGWRAGLSLYYRLLTLRWPGFLALMVVFYLLANLLFAVAYVCCGPEALDGGGAAWYEARLLEAFFFSVHTLSTVGYGHIRPGNLCADVVMTVEAMVSMITLALMTGLIFARFSRPLADIVYSRFAVVGPFEEATGLMFRIANRRFNPVNEVEVEVFYSDLSGEDRTRRFVELPLERSRVTFFPLSWTVVHPIDEASPLAGLCPQDLLDREAEILIQVSGLDEAFNQTVHSRTSYRGEEVIWNARFAEVIEVSKGGGRVSLDLRRIHEIERL